MMPERPLRRISYAILSLRRNDEVKLEDLHSLVKVSKDALRNALSYLDAQGIIKIINDNNIKVISPLNLALLCLRLGMDERSVSKHLDWRDFEKFISKLLEYYDYLVYRNFRFSFKGKRYEVDVIGVSYTYSLIIDCKHWQKVSPSKLHDVTLRHRERTEALAKGYRGGWFDIRGLRRGSKLVPVLITLTSPRVPVINNVLIVPISMLKGFLDDIYGVIEEFNVEVFEV